MFAKKIMSTKLRFKKYFHRHLTIGLVFIGSVFLFPTPVFALVPIAAGAAAAGLAAVYYFFPEIVALLGSSLLNLTGAILTFASYIFNWLIEYTVVGFAGTLSSLQMIGPINAVWSAFRDIGNIVIIGMFVFVAISIILGLQTYGEKKMIAKLLIVAVLINFSLFFTKVVIDTSHIAANQFYKSIAAVSGTNSPAGGPINDENARDQLEKTGGIAGAFLVRIGVSGVWDNYDTLVKTANANGSWFVLFYSLSGAAILAMVSFVLLYGSFLLASRAVLLVFLMTTSSLAFASYLIPKLSDNQYGWRGWWDSLLQSAFMAPLLLIFLWASLFILQGTPGVRDGSIGKFLSNPGDENNWQVVVLFVFATGFLFASIKLSKTLSTKITGFRIASRVPALAGIASSLIAGAALRRGAGIPSGWAQKGLATLGRKFENKEGKGAKFFARRLDNMAQGFDKLRKADFNAANTKLGKALVAEAGLKNKLAGTTKIGGVAGVEDARAKRQAEQASRLKLTDSEKEDVLKTAVQAAKDAQPERENAKSIYENAEKEIKEAERMKERDHTQYMQMQKHLIEKVNSAKNRAEKETLREELRNVEKEHRLEMKVQDDRIKAARSEKSHLERLDKKAEEEALLNPRVQSAGRDTKEIAREVANTGFSNMLKDKFGVNESRLAKAMGIDSGRLATLSEEAVGKISQEKSDKRLLKRLKDLQEEDNKSKPNTDESEEDGK